MKLKLTHPASAFLKQAHSRAKIISKVIHQPAPDSLTQTTMSACTDGAIHCSEGNIDVICGNQEGMNCQVAECEWEQPESHVERRKRFWILNKLKRKHSIKALHWNDNNSFSGPSLLWATGVDGGSS